MSQTQKPKVIHMYNLLREAIHISTGDLLQYIITGKRLTNSVIEPGYRLIDIIQGSADMIPRSSDPNQGDIKLDEDSIKSTLSKKSLKVYEDIVLPLGELRTQVIESRDDLEKQSDVVFNVKNEMFKFKTLYEEYLELSEYVNKSNVYEKNHFILNKIKQLKDIIEAFFKTTDAVINSENVLTENKSGKYKIKHIYVNDPDDDRKPSIPYIEYDKNDYIQQMRDSIAIQEKGLQRLLNPNYRNNIENDDFELKVEDIAQSDGTSLYTKKQLSGINDGYGMFITSLDLNENDDKDDMDDNMDDSNDIEETDEKNDDSKPNMDGGKKRKTTKKRKVAIKKSKQKSKNNKHKKRNTKKRRNKHK
jgi:hypothetical protein